jgi:hypothetical protein
LLAVGAFILLFHADAKVPEIQINCNGACLQKA